MSGRPTHPRGAGRRNGPLRGRGRFFENDRHTYRVDSRERGRGGQAARQWRPDRRDRNERENVAYTPRHQRTKPPTDRWTTEDVKNIAASSSAEALQRVTNEQAAFLNAFEFYPRRYDDPRIMKNLVRILYHMISTEVEADKGFSSRMFSLILSGEGKFASFCMKLKVLIQTTMFEQHAGRDDRREILFALIKIGTFCINKIPQSVVFTFPFNELKDTIGELSQDVSEHEFGSLKAPLREFEVAFMEKRQEVRRNRQVQSQQLTHYDFLPTDLDDQDPPNDFRQVQILPVAEEIQNPGKKPFLRTNLVGKEYSNWDHYLDVQFRLLREDFIAPLRKGIECFVQSGERSSDVLVYVGVHVVAPVCLYTGIGFQIQFDLERSHLSRVRWEHSRRLIFGSLLCLSNDDFQNVRFATIVNRDVSLLSEGKITVKFEGNVSGFQIDPSEEFLMVESTAYLEAYRHVLERLQQINTDQMPFKSYIVGGFHPQKIPFPHYCHEGLILDLNQVLELKKAKRRFEVKSLSKWPHHEETCLDESQIKALQMALTQEVSVIQGPPGTGKTYIGLKIVEALLQNRHAWDPKKNSPILVVCYTNHALDQFLEGIQSCQINEKQPKIVRVGGRCKSEKIKDCALLNVVKRIKEEKNIPTGVFRARRECQLTIKDQKEQMETIFKAEDILKGKILTTDDLVDSMFPDHFYQLTDAQNLSGRDGGKEIEIWLNLWYPTPTSEELQDYNEDDLLAVETTASLPVVTDLRPEEYIPEAQGIDGQLINIEDEPQLLEQDRLDEGEQDLLATAENEQRKPRRHNQVKSEAFQENLSTGWQIKQLDDRTRKNRIFQGMKHLPMSSEQAEAITDIWTLSIEMRWQLYHYWLNRYIQQKKDDVRKYADSYKSACDRRQEVDKDVNILALQGADIVGMTTTGAAKHSYILKGGIHPKVVIIEEAAEVFESHVVTSLCPSVEQLVLIGDHKQLRPKPHCFELEKKYLLHISLFERLAKNGFPLATLAYQHRMRPEIATIVANHVYDRLENALSVYDYPCIRGIGKNLFFIDHNRPERANLVADQRSHVNPFEACFLVAFCRYLLQQDYHPTQITLLTMYRGQLIELKHMMKKDEFEGVRVAAVDDFQGEENDIILLSLVRSNSDGKIGFLKIENRICVALSRARYGMYVIGNLTMLHDKTETKWPAILNDLEKRKFLGTGIPLCCQNHPNDVIIARTPEDFTKRPEGGCGRVCGFRLSCGHACQSPCHFKDMEHRRLYKCHKVCNKVIPSCGHDCTNRCFKCVDGHPPCNKRVTKVIPKCKHRIEMPCGTDPNTFPCPRRCTKRLKCGDLCAALCSMPCTKKCLVMKLNIQLPCGHTSSVACYLSKSYIECSNPCKELLACGHECAGTCSTCNRGRLHIQCQSKCDRTLSCGHICTFPCTANCPPCTEPCNNYCSHSKCPKLCYEPCALCIELCEWTCPHFQCQQPCGYKCTRPRCNYPCQKQLQCGHQCIGVCGEKCPTLCRKCNKDEVEEIFFGTEDKSDAMFIQLQDCPHFFEVFSLDKWMKTSTVGEGETHEIQLRKCPQCSTPIRRSLRYGNEIKATVREVEEVKVHTLQGVGGSKPQIKVLMGKLKQVHTQAKENACIMQIEPLIKWLFSRLEAPEGWRESDVTWLFPHHINTIQNQLLIVSKLVKLFHGIKLLGLSSCQLESITILPTKIKQDAMVLVKFLLVDYLTDQQLDDCHCELRRLFCLQTLCELVLVANKSKKTFEERDRKPLADTASLLIESGHTKPKLKAENQKVINELLSRIGNHYKLATLVEYERMEIVEAIGLPKGHWYKCPNGHVYCIGECGGAEQVGRCPDCKEKIGGRHHALLEGNVHAPEMDGSEHPAWSDAANLLNFDPEQLRNL